MTSHIIRNPTPDNSPDTIVTLDPNDIDHILESYIPQRFDDARTASYFWEKYINCNLEDKDKHKRAYIRHETQWHITFYALLLSGLVLSFLAVIFTSSHMHDILHYAAVTIFGLSGIASIIAVLYDHRRDNVHFAVTYGFMDNPNPHYVSRKDTKTLNSMNCINIHAQCIPTEHVHTLKSLRYVLSRNNDRLSSIVTLPDLRQAYNDYTGLLSFLWTNQSTLSAELVENYYAELQQRHAVLDKEIATACHLLNETEVICADFTHQQQDIIQRMHDADALRCIPLSDKK